MSQTTRHSARTTLKKLGGVFSLIMTTLLWGTSFAFIKLSVGEVDPYTYTFVRTLIASLALSPLVLVKYARRKLDYGSVKRGLLTGLAYSTGLFLQAAGTAYIDPSTSAFITGLSTIHVHVYTITVVKKYSWLDLLALVTAMVGLFILTSPSGGLGAGGLLVFSATFMWALQIILISKYRDSSMLEFLLGTFLAGLLFAPLSLYSFPALTTEAVLYLVYLALVCSVGATFFQVLGQRYVSASTAALIFLLEPVFATVFSVLMGLENVQLYKVSGGGLILLSLYLATVSEVKGQSKASEQ